jgi:hypothetical protein
LNGGYTRATGLNGQLQSAALWKNDLAQEETGIKIK